MVLPSKEESELIHLRRTAASLDKMRQSGNMTDVALVCVSREFKAHRLLLISSSLYFNSLLNGKWQDTSCERYNMTGWPANIIAAMLSFVYTGKITEASLLDDKTAMRKLLLVADYFQIEDLVEYCFESYLHLAITNSDFWEVYHLAAKLNSHRPMLHIEHLFAANFIELSKSKEFLDLTKFQLERLLKNLDIKDISLDIVFTAVLRWTSFDSQRTVVMRQFVEIIDSNWCSACINGLLKENTSIELWPPEVKQFLSEILAIRCDNTLRDTRKVVTFTLTNLMHMYDLKRDEWLPNQWLPFEVDCAAAVVGYKGHVFFLGGRVDSKASTKVVQYCPSTNTVVEQSGELISGTSWAGAGIFNDFIYVVNGSNIQHKFTRTVQRYDPNDKTCHLLSSTLKHYLDPLVFSFKDYLYVSGMTRCNIYRSDVPLNYNISVERYDAMSDQWTVLVNTKGIFNIRYFDYSAFSGGKIFWLNYINSNRQFYTFDLVSKEWDIVCHNRQSDIEVLWSIRQNGNPVLVAFDDCNAPHFYDVWSEVWVKKGPTNNHEDIRLWTSCCL